MDISVFGLGYVGSVSAACLASDGHNVIGVDVNPYKLEQLNNGLAPVLEPGLQERVSEAVQEGRLRAIDLAKEAVHLTDLSLICVGTPSQANGSLDLTYVMNVCREIGSALALKQKNHTVVLRSTVTPGTVREKVLPMLERCSGKRAGVDFDLCMNPEFLREGSAVKDYYHPSYIVLGSLNQDTLAAVETMYEAVDAPVMTVSLETAEMLKYANNAFHALKIAFANEIGVLSKAQGIDGRKVMEMVCEDKQLNISPAYLRPGFAFGGSCLPKDLRALTYQARSNDLDLPLLSAIVPSNKMHMERGIQLVETVGNKKVGVLGLSFKAGTDDVRESPMIPLIETLVGRGYDLSVYDDKVDPNSLIGANKRFLEKELPHITSLMKKSIEEVIENTETIVLAHDFKRHPEIIKTLTDKHTVIDLEGNELEKKENYHGICW